MSDFITTEQLIKDCTLSDWMKFKSFCKEYWGGVILTPILFVGVVWLIIFLVGKIL